MFNYTEINFWGKQMIQKPNTRALLFDAISDFCKPAIKRKAVGEFQRFHVLKRICGSDSKYV